MDNPTENETLTNPALSPLLRRVSALERRNSALQQQMREMQRHCKFYAHLYSGLKLDLVHTKHVLLEKLRLPDGRFGSWDGDGEGEGGGGSVEELREELRKVKLENEELKAMVGAREGCKEVGCNGGLNAWWSGIRQIWNWCFWILGSYLVVKY